MRKKLNFVFLGLCLLLMIHPASETRAGSIHSSFGFSGSSGQQGNPDISGRWVSTIGLTYEISVTGSDFAWKEIRTGQTAKGRIEGLSVQASWRGILRTDSATGTITLDDFGRAVKIEWSNKVVFTRPAGYFRQAPDANAIPSGGGASIAGQWKSNIGAVYTITQRGNAVAWTVAGSRQRGEGMIAGENIKASWSDGGGKGSATGRLIRDRTGIPIRIEWSNGVVFTPAGPQTTPGRPAEQPPSKTAPQPTDGARAEAVVPATLELAEWHRGAAQELRHSATLGDSREFLRRMGDPQSLRQLSGQTGLSEKQLLFLAHELELRGLIGAGGASPSEWALLKELGVETVDGLRRFSNKPERLQTAMTNLALRKNLPPPDPGRMKNWIAAAASKTSSVARVEAGLGRPAAGTGVELTPLQVREFGAKAGQAKTQQEGFVFHIARPLGSFTIDPRQTEHLSEFRADEPGLYRAKVTFDRQGGAAVLGWRIDRPRVVLQGGTASVTSVPSETVFGSDDRGRTSQPAGYQTLIQGKQPLEQITDNWLYFYVKPSLHPVSNTLYLRLTVLQNQGQQDAVKDAIEQMDPKRKSDPTIRGSVQVDRVSPLKLRGFDEKVVFPVNRDSPLYLVRTPLYQGARQQFQMPSSLVMVVAHDPQKFGQRFPAGDNSAILGTYPAQGGVRPLPHVLRDESAVNGLQSYHEQYEVIDNQSRPVPFRGVDVVKIDSPQDGVYSLLVGSDSRKANVPSFEQLATEGYVYSHWEADPEPSDTRVFIHGGQVPKSVYVAELESLEVSTQSETDDDNNDKGLGEFKVNVCALLSSRNPYEGIEGFTSPQTFKRSWSVTYPEYPDWLLPDWLYIRPSLDGQRNICFPKMPIAAFSEEDAAKSDVFTAVVNVIEDDDFEWWDLNKGLFSLLEDIAKVFINALGQNYTAAAKSFWEVVTFDEANLVADEVDDKVGFPILKTGGETDWGLKGGRYFVFESSGPARLEFRDTEGYPMGAKDFNGWVSTTDDTPFARATISMRKRLAPFSWAKVELKEFTVRPGTSGPGENVDVIVRKGHLQYGTLSTKYGKLAFQPLYGEAYSTFYAQWTDSLNLMVQTGKPVGFPVSPPPQPAVDDLTENPYTYIQWEFLEDLPGSDDLLGIVSFTLYHEDFYRAVVLKENPFAEDKYGSLSQGAVLSKYSKQGPFYVGEFTLQDPGTWLQNVKLVAYVYIHE